MPERDVQVGAVLAGKYRVERVLGQGGMGVVVEATQLDLARRVALKFLRKPGSAETAVALSRFEREARTIARLRGAHVVQVYDVGRLDHGEPFIVMELLQGEDLSVVLDRELRLPVTTAVDYVLQTCEAIAEAHAAGVIHRDLKPANLFLARGPDGRPLLKVLDFGISKLMAAETTSLSLTSGVLGSPLYMSPEQLSSSKQVDYRCDIWSLGTILYELITGKAAFQADGLPQVCTRVMLGSPDRMSDAVDVPAGLETAILKCLNKTPEGRHLSVADLAVALNPFARGSSHRSAEAAIRIIRSSGVPHGDLPYSLDSMPPPAQGDARLDGSTDLSGPPSSVVRELNRADGSRERTLNISAPPPGGITQQELKPLVSATALRTTEPSKARGPKAALLGVLALIVTMAIFVGLRLGSRGSAGSAPSADPAAVASPGVAPASAAAPLALPVPVPVEAPGAPSVPVAAPAVSSSPAAAKLTPPRKPRPAPRRVEPDAEELLKHR